MLQSALSEYTATLGVSSFGVYSRVGTQPLFPTSVSLGFWQATGSFMKTAAATV